jgi:hypothetical protein
MVLEGKIKPLGFVGFAMQAVVIITAAVVAATSDVAPVSSQDLGNAK